MSNIKVIDITKYISKVMFPHITIIVYAYIIMHIANF